MVQIHLEAENKGGAFVLSSGEAFNLASVIFNNFFADRKAHAYPILVLIIRVRQFAKKFEQFFRVIFLDSSALIDNVHSKHLV